MSLNNYNVIDGPILSEESQIQTEHENKYTFRVRKAANKVQIRTAVESMFPNVKVVAVNTMNYNGKARRVFGTRRVGKTAAWKKAVVTLRAGDKIDLI